MIDFASTLWKRKNELIDAREILFKLYNTVNRRLTLTFQQWIQLYTMTREFSPDLIIELGRGYGNSTCVFTEAVNRNHKGHIISIGYDSQNVWKTVTVPELKKFVSSKWFDKLQVMEQDIMKIDFTEIIDKSERVLLFWDAHGYELSQYILANIFPHLQNKEHLIIIDDVFDVNCWPKNQKPFSYTNFPYSVQINNLIWEFSEFVRIIDFISRNGILYDTPCSSLTKFYETSPELEMEMKTVQDKLIGNLEKMEDSKFIFFDLNNTNQLSEIDFPNYTPHTVPLEFYDEFFDFRALHEKNILKNEEFKPERLSYDSILYNKQFPELGNYIQVATYGLILPQDMIIQREETFLFIPSNRKDHIFTKQIKVIQRDSEDEKWVRITLTFNQNKIRDRSCVICLQDEKFREIWTFTSFYTPNLENKQNVVDYAFLDNASGVRFVIYSISGKATYLPIGIKLEQSFA